MTLLTKVDAIDGCLMGIGLTVSVQDIQATLSIVIIVIDILWLLGKFIIKLFRYLDDGKLSDDEVDDLMKTKDQIDDLKKQVQEDDDESK